MEETWIQTSVTDIDDEVFQYYPERIHQPAACSIHHLDPLPVNDSSWAKLADRCEWWVFNRAFHRRMAMNVEDARLRRRLNSNWKADFIYLFIFF